jgi:hypothetical protein
MTDLAVILGFGLATWIINTQLPLAPKYKRAVNLLVLALVLFYVVVLGVHRLFPSQPQIENMPISR